MINFKKETIFTRKPSKMEDIKEGILAVWGSPGCGKTITAIKLAKYLADRKKDVILVLCDMTAPMLPCVCPSSMLENERSLGSILSSPHVNTDIVKENIITHKKMSHLTILGMLRGENEYTYASYSKVQVEELMGTLREIAPYIIVDCSSYIANDILSAVSVMKADHVLRLANCDLKSVSYLSSQLKLLHHSNWNSSRQYKGVSNLKANHGISHMAGALGDVAFKIPYSDEVEEQFLSGNLLGDLSLKASRGFNKEIEKITREVFGC